VKNSESILVGILSAARILLIPDRISRQLAWRTNARFRGNEGRGKTEVEEKRGINGLLKREGTACGNLFFAAEKFPFLGRKEARERREGDRATKAIAGFARNFRREIFREFSKCEA